MKNRNLLKIVPLSILLVFALSMHAQDWRDMMANPHANYQEVLNAFEKERAGRPITTVPQNKKFGRWQAFWQGKILKDGTLDTLWSKRTFEMVQERNRRLEKTVGLRSGPSNWSHLGPSNPPLPQNKGLGRIYRVVFHPTDPTTIFAASEFGGIWKKTGTDSWVNITESWALLGASALAIDPTNPNVMYASTGSTYSLTPSTIGILKTTDGGQSWTNSGLSSVERIQDLVIHPTNSNILIANTYYGLSAIL